ncbi:hypothetical protein FBR02_11655 [Anaerolineae bacterium CFX9]|nr:hypothetical protein [Anaerolineae bacterium CFX9]
MRNGRALWFASWIVPVLMFIGVFALLSGLEPINAAPAAQTTPEAVFAFDARGDLEVLADEALGPGVRPSTWIGNLDVNTASFIADLWFDNEQLADTIFGPGLRPPDWIGASVVNTSVIARNTRHDLEISADQVFGIGVRPPIWRGAPALVRCDRTTQNILSIVARFYRIQPQTPESALNYCAALRAEFEDELINLIFGTPNANGLLRDPLDDLSAVRGDLERLADELLGLNTRPLGWVGNRDRNSATLIGDIFLDINMLANDQLGDGVRPDGWIGVVTNSPANSALNLRHDLELLATQFYLLERPRGWQSTNPVDRCVPALQALVFVIEQNYSVGFSEIDPTALDYCARLNEAANSLVENPPVLDIIEEEQRYNASSEYAFAYLNVAATQYMGIMPGGTRFRAVYRNFGESNMMFVTGADFALYVDRRFTTLDETLFNSLPTLEGVNPVTYCDAVWCNGPGPTPTPTGSGPLIAILIQTTPVATPDPTVLETTKQLVSWNYVRVTYVFDDLNTRTAQVALEVCAQPAEVATACEPVISVFDSATGANRPVLSQFNGLNVYEFRYGYSTNLVIEGSTRYANDVWISDPTIR